MRPVVLQTSSKLRKWQRVQRPTDTGTELPSPLQGASRGLLILPSGCQAALHGVNKCT